MYFTIYNNTLETAGIEAYGCANITTYLIEPDILEEALTGNEESKKKLGERLNWTIDHKHIFRNQYILDLNGNVMSADKNSTPYGIKVGEKHPTNMEDITYLKEEKKPTYSKVYKVNGNSTLTGYAPIFEDNDPIKDVIAISAIDFDGLLQKERSKTFGQMYFETSFKLLWLF
jgi:methyl-accepting chemotaxis protein